MRLVGASYCEGHLLPPRLWLPLPEVQQLRQVRKLIGILSAALKHQGTREGHTFLCCRSILYKDEDISHLEPCCIPRSVFRSCSVCVLRPPAC